MLEEATRVHHHAKTFLKSKQEKGVAQRLSRSLSDNALAV